MEPTVIERTWTTRIDELADEHPDVTALIVTGPAGRSLSWRELADRSAGVARLFAGHGVIQGSIVSVALPNCLAHVLATLAAWRLGATVLPLRHDLPLPERARLFELAHTALAVTETAIADESVGGAHMLSAAEVMAVAATAAATLPPAPVARPAWLIATGGSTGKPKLVVPSLDTTIGAGGIQGGDRRSRFADNTNHRHPTALVCTPLGHTHGFAVLHRTLIDDFRVILMHKFDAEEMLDLIERERVSFIPLVPTMLLRAIRSPTVRSRDLSSIELTMSGAGAMADWAIKEWMEIVGPTRFMVGYGSSEGVATSFIRGDEWLAHPSSVGKPINAEVMVVDENNRRLPAGEVGELYFRPFSGEYGFHYVGGAEIRHLPGGYVSIGDLGWVDADGYLYISDRRTDMVVTGGSNVYVAEVEAVLTAHPDVIDAAVIGLPDPEWGRRVHAVLQLRHGADAAGVLAALPAHCKERLAAYKVPRGYEAVADLGRSEVGKVNRQALVKAREAGAA